MSKSSQLAAEEKSRLFTVRFTNVPLPVRTGLPLEPGVERTARPTPAAFQDSAGGALSGVTVLDGHPAEAGREIGRAHV